MRKFNPRKIATHMMWLAVLATFSLMTGATTVLAQTATPSSRPGTHNPLADARQGLQDNRDNIFFIGLIIGVGGYIFGQVTGHSGIGIAILVALFIGVVAVAGFPMFTGGVCAYGGGC